MKRTTTFLFIILLSVTTLQESVHSQWIQTNGLTTEFVYALLTYGTEIFAGTGSGTYLTTNYGNNWQNVLNISARSLASSGINIFAGTQTAGIYLSTNNGANWVQVNSGLTANYVRSLTFSGSNVFAGTTTAGVFLSTNNGGSWMPVNNGLTNLYIFSLLTHGTDIYAGTGNVGGIFKSTNNGASWSFSGANNQYVYALVSRSNNIFAGTDLGGVFLSTDNGTSWVQVNNGLTDLFVNSMAVKDSIVFAGTHGGVYYSTNNGALWISCSSGLPSGSWIYAMAIDTPYIFAGTYGHGVWRRLLSEIVSVKKIASQLPNQFVLYQNSPNPFNPVTRIKFDVPPVGAIHELPLRLALYDVLGREIATLVNDPLTPGSYEVEWDGTNYPSGVYFYKLITNEFSEAKRMVLVK